MITQYGMITCIQYKGHIAPFADDSYLSPFTSREFSVGRSSSRLRAVESPPYVFNSVDVTQSLTGGFSFSESRVVSCLPYHNDLMTSDADCELSLLPNWAPTSPSLSFEAFWLTVLEKTSVRLRRIELPVWHSPTSL